LDNFFKNHKIDPKAFNNELVVFFRKHDINPKTYNNKVLVVFNESDHGARRNRCGASDSIWKVTTCVTSTAAGIATSAALLLMLSGGTLAPVSIALICAGGSGAASLSTKVSMEVCCGPRKEKSSATSRRFFLELVREDDNRFQEYVGKSVISCDNFVVLDASDEANSDSQSPKKQFNRDCCCCF